MSKVGRKSMFNNTGEPKAGRPRKEPEKGKARNVTTMLYQNQIDYLDDLIYTIRKEKRASLNRAEILRGILDAVIESDLNLEATSEADIKRIVKDRLAGN